MSSRTTIIAITNNGIERTVSSVREATKYLKKQMGGVVIRLINGEEQVIKEV